MGLPLALQGLVSLLCLAAPALVSLMAACRLEADKGSMANRLQYARLVVRPMGVSVVVWVWGCMVWHAA